MIPSVNIVFFFTKTMGMEDISLEYEDMTEKKMVMVFPSALASQTFVVLQLSQNMNCSRMSPFTTLVNHAATAAPHQIHLKALSNVWNSCIDKLI